MEPPGLLHDVDDNMTSCTFNVTGVEDCDSLKVEMAVTLAFLAGIIMVQYTLVHMFVYSHVMTASRV